MAAITIFEFKEVYELNRNKAVLAGEVVFNNNKKLQGKITIDLKTREVSYRHRGRFPIYTLYIDPSKKQLWDELVQTLINITINWTI